MDNISISNEIEKAVEECLERLHMEKIEIDQSIFQQIEKELNEVSKFFMRINARFKKSSAYSKFTGFTYSNYHYELSATRAEEALVYQHLNNILALLRNNQHMTYALYVNEQIEEGHSQQYRYEVPAEQLDEFLRVVQANNALSGLQSDFRSFVEKNLQRMKEQELVNEHLQKFLSVAQETNAVRAYPNTIGKLSNLYEAFEYHFQIVDKKETQNLAHSDFNQEGISNWLFARMRDTVSWYRRGDIELTSVKSIDLEREYNYISLASQTSLNRVYSLLREIFSKQELDKNELSQLVRAFTPAISELKRDINYDLNKVVDELIHSLIKF